MISTRIDPAFNAAVVAIAENCLDGQADERVALEGLAPFQEDLIEVLQDIYDEYCPDNDLMLLSQYVPTQIFRTVDASGAMAYDCQSDQGVIVNVDEYSGRTCRLFLLPNPARFVLDVEGEGRTTVWRLAED